MHKIDSHIFCWNVCHFSSTQNFRCFKNFTTPGFENYCLSIYRCFHLWTNFGFGTVVRCISLCGCRYSSSTWWIGATSTITVVLVLWLHLFRSCRFWNRGDDRRSSTEFVDQSLVCRLPRTATHLHTRRHISNALCVL